MNGGSAAIALATASPPRAAIAPVVVGEPVDERGEVVVRGRRRRSTSLRRARRGSARSSGVSWLSSSNSRCAATSDGLRYCQPAFGLLAAARVRSSPKPRMTLRRPFARLLVEQREELVEVDGGGRVARRRSRRRRGSSSSPPPRRGGSAGRRSGSATPDSDAHAQRRLRALRAAARTSSSIVELDLGLAVVGQLDLLDQADGRARDLHEVALDDLGRGLEAGADLDSCRRR